MLVTVKNHVLQTPKTKRPKISFAVTDTSTAFVKVGIVWSFELDAQIDSALFCLPLENRYNLRTDVT